MSEIKVCHECKSDVIVKRYDVVYSCVGYRPYGDKRNVEVVIIESTYCDTCKTKLSTRRIVCIITPDNIDQVRRIADEVVE